MISIIVAIAQNGIIGGENNLLWHIKEDLLHFKNITTGHPVVMGRKTFESIGKPLPNRTNVVITRQKDYKIEGGIVVHSLDEAIGLFPPEEEIFIIGGGEIYKQAWSIADRLYITWIDAPFDGDTFLSKEYVKKVGALSKTKLNLWEWEKVSRKRYERGVEFPYPFEFAEYHKVQRELPFP
jgi:dihydrofolate reductase